FLGNFQPFIMGILTPILTSATNGNKFVSSMTFSTLFFVLFLKLIPTAIAKTAPIEMSIINHK
ncbi:hypothetical protein, partial [Acetobacterium wieringae]|uniref:hypothetical protein n=1 Tax=Acetobacterium wieringae TaxID=52694 RepID=UPI0026EEE6A5